MAHTIFNTSQSAVFCGVYTSFTWMVDGRSLQDELRRSKVMKKQFFILEYLGDVL